MSILIKGMEMPKPGAYMCELGVLDNNTAVLTIYTPIDEPQKGYMLVPVPSHGRLIDADALLRRIALAETNQPEIADVYVNDYIIVRDWLYSAPTILEAEEGE